MRVVPFVCAVLGIGTLWGGCRSPQGAGFPSLDVAAPSPARDGRETRVSYTLPNGVTIVLEESHISPTVALQAWVAAGAADEAPDEAGLAHLVERVVVGAPVDPARLPLAAWSSHEATVYEALVAPSAVGTSLDALAALLGRATFDAAAVDRARAEVVAELRQGGRPDDASALATRTLFAAAFGQHPYGRDVRGAEAAVQGLTRDQAAAFHRRTYGGAHVTLVAVGDFDARAVRARAATAFANLPAGPPRGAPVAPPAAAGPQAAVVRAEGRDERLAVGFRLPVLDAAELAAVDVLAVALARGGRVQEGDAGGASGRLGRELVQNLQLAASARASVFAGRAAGLLVLEAKLTSGRADEAARVVLAQALALARDELPPSELEAARATLEGDLVRGKATTSAYARKLGFFAAVARDPSYEDRYLERLRALSPRAVRAAGAKVLRASDVALAAVVAGPAGEGAASAALAARLRDVAAAGEARADADRKTARPTAVTAAADVVRVVLPAGPRVLVLRDPTVGAVWVEALWAGGVRVEDPRSNGVTSLLAATLTRGTRTRSAAKVAADAAAAGGSIAGVAGPDELGLRAQFLSRDWEAGLELLADCVRHPAFPEAEVEAARRAQLTRAREEEDDAAQAARRLLAGALWPRHPYRLPLLGTPESLSLLTRRRVAEHYRRAYGTSNLVIAVVGDVDTERVVARLQALFAGAPPALDPLAPAAPPVPPQAAEVVRPAPAGGSRVVVGYAGVATRDPDRVAALVLARALTARLAAEPGAPAAEVRAWSGADGGSLTFDVATTPDDLDAAVPALRAALARVVAAGLTAPEVARAKEALVAERVRALEHRGAVATALARGEALGPDAGAGRDAPGALAAVTPEAVTRVARRLLDPSHELVAAVRPGGGRVPAP